MSIVYRITEHGVDWEPLEIKNGRVVKCKRITELEANNMDAAVAYGKLLKRIEKLEARLQRVGELPEKWREISYKTTEEYTNLHGCADELESALGD